MTSDTSSSGLVEPETADMELTGSECIDIDLAAEIEQQGSSITDRFLRPAFEAAFDDSLATGWSTSFAKRLVDLAVSIPALLVLAVPMLVIALVIRLMSRGPAVFVQSRVGRDGRLFAIYKFRTMSMSSSVIEEGPGITQDGDCRITAIGRWLRRLKLDEIPQFYNVLRGDMSLVGPRPKLPQYSAVEDMPYRPGITGTGSLVFRNEEELLKGVDPDDLEAFYEEHIKPLKAQIDSCYMRHATLLSDIRVIVATLMSCLITEPTPLASRTVRESRQSQESRQSRIDADEGFETAGS